MSDVSGLLERALRAESLVAAHEKRYQEIFDLLGAERHKNGDQVHAVKALLREVDSLKEGDRWSRNCIANYKEENEALKRLRDFEDHLSRVGSELRNALLIVDKIEAIERAKK